MKNIFGSTIDIIDTSVKVTTELLKEEIEETELDEKFGSNLRAKLSLNKPYIYQYKSYIPTSTIIKNNLKLGTLGVFSSWEKAAPKMLTLPERVDNVIIHTIHFWDFDHYFGKDVYYAAVVVEGDVTWSVSNVGDRLINSVETPKVDIMRPGTLFTHTLVKKLKKVAGNMNKATSVLSVTKWRYYMSPVACLISFGYGTDIMKKDRFTLEQAKKYIAAASNAEEKKLRESVYDSLMFTIDLRNNKRVDLKHTTPVVGNYSISGSTFFGLLKTKKLQEYKELVDVRGIIKVNKITKKSYGYGKNCSEEELKKFEKAVGMTLPAYDRKILKDGGIKWYMRGGSF